MLQIRPFQSSDAPVLRRTFFNAIRTINIRDYTQAQVRAWAPDKVDEADWSARLTSINPFVAVLDGEVVGYSDLQDDGYIDHFFCHADYQGKGIGKALMNRIFDSATERNITRLYSHVSITAKPFFEHFGFVVVKPQTVTIRGEALNNFVMENRSIK